MSKEVACGNCCAANGAHEVCWSCGVPMGHKPAKAKAAKIKKSKRSKKSA